MEANKRNASGRLWTAGPYVRKKERPEWDRFYRAFKDELTVTLRFKDYEHDLTSDQIEILAYNLAYRAIWELREG